MVVSVHPDDETIGAGGTLLRHRDQGDRIGCIFVTDGNTSQAETIAQLEDAYGFDAVFRLGLPEITLQDLSLSVIIPKLGGAFRSFEPNIVYLPNRSDPHSDHRRVFEAAQACTKAFRYPSVERVMMMEVISETDFAPALPEAAFMPNVFVDVSDYQDRKMEILDLFRSELMPSPMTRSADTMRAYNRYRGSQINAEYAECFMLLKDIVR
ncbi:MAG: PIG-L deacetylase family protein [Pseudomonadota bacterium]